MITFQELKLITSKLEIIEEMKEPLQSLLVDVEALLQKGMSWIRDVQNCTYDDVKQVLDTEIDAFIKKCFTIASKSQLKLEKEQVNPTTGFPSVEITSAVREDEGCIRDVFVQTEECPTNATSDLELIETIQQKIEDQERLLEHIADLELQNNERFENVWQELQSASEFMSNLNTQMENMAAELKITEQNQRIMEEQIQEQSQKLVKYSEENNSQEKVHENIENLKEEVKKLTDKLAATNEVLKTMEKEVFQLINKEDLKGCLQIAIEGRKVNDEEYFNEWCEQPVIHRITGAGLVRYVTELLNDFGLSTSEHEVFWNEYEKCQNK